MNCVFVFAKYAFAADLFALNGCAQVIVVSSCCCILTDGVKVIAVTIKFWPGLETESCALFIWLDAMATLPAFCYVHKTILLPIYVIS